MLLEKIDHICIAVKDRENAEKQWSLVFGIEPEMHYIDEDEKIDVARFRVGESALEVMQSTSPEGEVARFIDKQGEGVFLISLKVPSVSAALTELKQKGIKLISQDAQDFKGCKYAFIHPSSLNGVLLELFEGEIQSEK